MHNHELLWTPSADFKSQSNLAHYIQWLRDERDWHFSDYDALWQWSVSEVDAFWISIADYFKVSWRSTYDTAITDEMPRTKWFTGGTLNYAEHLMRHKSDDRPALIFQNEEGRKDIAWQDLEDQVLRVRAYLVSHDIGVGDRVACYMPNIPEAIIAFIAVNSLGAIWTCCSPDFGVDTVIERFSQVTPEILIACDGYRYNGKPYDRRSEVKQIAQEITSIKHVLLDRYLDADSTMSEVDYWSDLEVADDAELHFEAVPFDHPIWILYSSGTTGKPKAITHSHGGVLLEHLKYMAFHNDAKPDETFFWFTTTGWMMWNYLQASMLVGAIPVLFDGSPGYPDMSVLWEMAEDVGLHHFGTSAPYLTACMKQDMHISDEHDLSQLRSIGSTGAPLPEEAFAWIYKAIKKDLWLCSMSGGTDVCTAFVGGNPLKPVYKGLIQTRALGCAMYAYDEAGHHVMDSLGEMVIEEPMPSMPIYFWGDTEGERYHASYFDTYPGKWRHGDWIKLYQDHSLIIQGRSDATLNRKGIRIGTAEIYNVLDQITALDDALIINIELPDGGDIMPLFVKVKSGGLLDDELKILINQSLRKQCSPRHVPDEIVLVPDIPYTLSGKKMEVPVKKLLMGITDPTNVNMEAIKNPEAMNLFITLIEKYQPAT